jgi:hypothetical protein
MGRRNRLDLEVAGQQSP